MSDINEAQSTEPGILREIAEEIHALEQKAEHLIHPEATPVILDQSGNVIAGGVEPASSGSDATAQTASATAAELPNQVGEASASSEIPNDAPAAAGIIGVNSQSATNVSSAVISSTVSSYIRSHLSAIRKTLSDKGFEQSAVQEIHTEIEAIERLL